MCGELMWTGLLAVVDWQYKHITLSQYFHIHHPTFSNGQYIQVS